MIKISLFLVLLFFPINEQITSENPPSIFETFEVGYYDENGEFIRFSQKYFEESYLKDNFKSLFSQYDSIRSVYKDSVYFSYQIVRGDHFPPHLYNLILSVKGTPLCHSTAWEIWSDTVHTDPQRYYMRTEWD